MKRRFIILAVVLSASTLRSQDMPLFSQKLINSFVYNPANAGYDFGAVTYVYRGSLSQLAGAGTLNYLSLEAPIMANNFGVAISAMTEKVNFLRNNSFVAAFSYHLKIAQSQKLSLGVSGEYINIQPDMSEVVGDISDEMLQAIDAGDYNHMDFSTGISYDHPYFRLSVSGNRLATAFKNDKLDPLAVQYYSGQLLGKIPTRGKKDLLEPMLSYRKFTRISHLWDVGLYYTLMDQFVLGGSVRIGGSNRFETAASNGVNAANITVAYTLWEKILLGYSMDIPMDNQYNVGLGNDFTLRYIFNKQSVSHHFESQRSPSRYRGTHKIRKKKRRRP